MEIKETLKLNGQDRKKSKDIKEAKRVKIKLHNLVKQRHRTLKPAS
jgi:hypothetical protein